MLVSWTRLQEEWAAARAMDRPKSCSSMGLLMQTHAHSLNPAHLHDVCAAPLHSGDELICQIVIITNRVSQRLAFHCAMGGIRELAGTVVAPYDHIADVRDRHMQQLCKLWEWAKRGQC